MQAWLVPAGCCYGPEVWAVPALVPQVNWGQPLLPKGREREPLLGRDR